VFLKAVRECDDKLLGLRRDGDPEDIAEAGINRIEILCLSWLCLSLQFS